jgi:hypothetical protein
MALVLLATAEWAVKSRLPPSVHLHASSVKLCTSDSYDSTDCSPAHTILCRASQNTHLASMTCSANGTKEIASGVEFSLGSDWVTVSSASATYMATDVGGKVIASKVETPPAAPLGGTNMLLGLQGSKDYLIQLVPLADAPEGGTCHP